MIELVPRPDQYPQDWDAWPVQHSLDEAFKVSQEDYETLRCSISPVAHGFLHYTGILSFNTLLCEEVNCPQLSFL